MAGSDAAFFEVLEADLRALCAEARRTDSLATQITGWLQHTDFPQLRDAAERALLRLRAVAHEGQGIQGLHSQACCAAPGRDWPSPMTASPFASLAKPRRTRSVYTT